MMIPTGRNGPVTHGPTTVFELEALEGLACGCVTAAFRAQPWDVSVVSLEAKGPYCILTEHIVGGVVRLGEPDDYDEDEEFDE